MRVLIAQPEFRVGRLEENYQLILREIEHAREEKCDLLMVSGVGLYNLSSYPELIRDTLSVYNRQQELIESLGQHAKGLHMILLSYQDITRTLSFMEFHKDRWILHEPDALSNFMSGGLSDFERNSMVEMLETKHGRTRFVVGATHANFSFEMLDEQSIVFVDTAQRHSCVTFRLSSGGVEGANVKLGHSGYFTPGGKSYELGVGQGRVIYDSKQPDEALQPCQPFMLAHELTAPLLYETLVEGLRAFFRAQGMQKATLGLSGGIDSAVVAVVAAEALGPENVLAVLLPSRYTSPESLRDAQQLATKLGIQQTTIPITPLTEAFEQSLQPLFGDLPPDTAEENLQARTRGVLLMAVSNKLGYTLLNTSNKSEIYVGYSTMYGDACGAISVLGDVLKTAVYALARHINREEEIIPQYIIDRPPSAELREGQTDQDSLPPYEVLDEFLQQLLQFQSPLPEIRESGTFDPRDIDRMVALIRGSRHKRAQFPPILGVNEPVYPFTESLDGIWPAE